MKKLILLLSLFSLGQNSFAQENEGKKSNLKISGYMEIFYSYDFNQPENHIRHPFFYTFNRHNEVNVNLASVKTSYETESMRANIALMAGTYPEDNMVAEQGMLKYIEEASLGVKISKTKNLWIDAGIMPSYIGLEGEISKDNLTLTRTVAIANSPFFMTGVKLSYATDDNKWALAAGIFNGWQKIRRVIVDRETRKVIGNAASEMLAFGTKVGFQPNEKWTFNSSTYIGNDPATESKLRLFHDFFTTYKPTNKWEFDFVFDVGVEQAEKASSKHYIWWSPNLIAKYHFTPKFSTAGRVEYYHDPNNVMGAAPEGNKFQIFGASVNFDYLINKNMMWRIEFRNLQSKEPIFIKLDKEHPRVDQNFFITTSLDAWF
ncbi:MAG: porin [Flavobacteriaceae bacterium]|nr:porin [Flavobacteriaceae bacterium]